MADPAPVRDVVRSIKAMYQSTGQPITTWSETPESARRSWFNHFKVNFLQNYYYYLNYSNQIRNSIFSVFLLTDIVQVGSGYRRQGVQRVF